MSTTFNWQDILNQFKTIQAETNKANDTRYKDIMAGLDTASVANNANYDKINGLISTLGQDQAGRLQQQQVRNLATSDQDLISRGLGNTTIRTTSQRGIIDDTNRAMLENQNAVAQQQAGVEMQRANSNQNMAQYIAQMKNARTDTSMSSADMMQLLMQAGQASAASKPQTIFTGLSANARAGRDATGTPFQYSGTSGSPSSPSFGQGQGGQTTPNGGSAYRPNATPSPASGLSGYATPNNTSSNGYVRPSWGYMVGIDGNVTYANPNENAINKDLNYLDDFNDWSNAAIDEIGGYGDYAAPMGSNDGTSIELLDANGNLDTTRLPPEYRDGPGSVIPPGGGGSGGGDTPTTPDSGGNNGLIMGHTMAEWERIYNAGAGLIGENYDIWLRAKQVLGK